VGEESHSGSSLSPVSGNGVTLGQDEIRGILSSADELARVEGEILVDQWSDWVNVVHRLREHQCPRTYLPVLGVLLVARSLRSESELDVLDIQQRTSSRGYAAASIGKALVPFAVEQGIDLRSKSSQIMNNQPFTFEPRIVPGMSKSSKAEYFNDFIAAATEVNAMSSETALVVLALMFHLCRLVPSSTPEVAVIEGGKLVLVDFVERATTFVNSYSDNGRVGQAFVAAAFDVVYGPEFVLLGNTADPDASVPGDVQVVEESGTWLWTEVKQKSVTTGDVETFIAKVRKVGGERLMYCAFGNERYPLNIDQMRIARTADKIGVEVAVFISAADFVGRLLAGAPGLFDAVASRFATCLLQRLIEAGCNPPTIESYRALLGGT